jgi:hypothetical protein
MEYIIACIVLNLPELDKLPEHVAADLQMPSPIPSMLWMVASSGPVMASPGSVGQ